MHTKIATCCSSRTCCSHWDRTSLVDWEREVLLRVSARNLSIALSLKISNWYTDCLSQPKVHSFLFTSITWWHYASQDGMHVFEFIFLLAFTQFTVFRGRWYKWYYQNKAYCTILNLDIKCTAIQVVTQRINTSSNTKNQ